MRRCVCSADVSKCLRSCAVSLAYAVLISINSRTTFSRMALSILKAEFRRQVVRGLFNWLVRRCNAIAIAGARYGILESARGCCGLPGDGSLHALRRWRQREPGAGRQLRVSPRLDARFPASGATMHLPASAMQLDHQSRVLMAAERPRSCGGPAT